MTTSGMKGAYRLSLLIASISLFNLTLADGIFNNYDNAKLIQSVSIVPSDGNYVFKNLGTGQIVQHDRKNNVPNLYTGGNKVLTAPTLHRLGNRSNLTTRASDDDVLSGLEIRSHKTRTKWISIRTAGPDDGTKCISAQWGYHTEGGADHAGTLYECVVDPLNLEATLEKTKQWWLLMPVKMSKQLKFYSEKPMILRNQLLNNKNQTEGISRVAKQEEKDNDNTMPTPFWNPKTNRVESFPGPNTRSKRNLNAYHDKIMQLQQAGLASELASTESDASKQVDIDGLYNDESSSEMDDDHDNLRKIASPFKIRGKRSATHAKSKPSRKESKPTSRMGPFYVVTVDHLYDMETRVWTSAVKKTVGNQLSLVIKKLDPNDKTQQWYLELQS